MSADRSMSMGEPDLEAALGDLGAVLALPTARAELAARVRARIEAERPRRAGVPWWRGMLPGTPAARPLRRSVVLAAAALLIAAAAVTAAIGFGLPGIRILFGGTPPPAASGTASPSNAPGALLGLGTPMSLEEAEGLLDFDVLLPPAPIGPPDAVYVQGPRITLVWGPGEELPGTANAGIGLVLVELRATIDRNHIDKLIFSGTSVETIDVEGAPGYWISGERHEIAYVGPNRDRISDTIRVAGNTLLWTEDGITYRLEGEFTLDAAIDLAASLR